MTSHNDVCHNWAHKTGQGRNGFNMFYEGDTIYSYGHHFPIARFIDPPAPYVGLNKEETKPEYDQQVRQVVLFNSSDYSVSTSKHQTYTRRAIPAYIDHVFYVPNLTDRYFYGQRRMMQAHLANYAAYLEEIKTNLDKASRARGRKMDYIHAADHARNEANLYTRVFKLGKRQLERPENMDSLIEAWRADQKLKQEARDKADRGKLKAWLSGSDIRPAHTRIPYVRVKGDQVQTTWGVSVPLRQAVALFRLARVCKATGKAFSPVKRHAIGHYSLDKITEEGTLRIGCHVIPLKVQAVAAKQIGLGV